VGCRMCQAICIKEAIFVSELFVPSKWTPLIRGCVYNLLNLI
jgi:formate hydrogenlyase subunit 6/NADH:ubiquinone oxidoreductase subunit I